jgi:hypothetical protein
MMFDDGCSLEAAMRTTLAIDDDVLTAAKAIAEQQHVSIGQVVSDLARRALHRPQAPATRNGVPLLPMRNEQAVITLETVNALRDDLP